jgi:hypothetical protein
LGTKFNWFKPTNTTKESSNKQKKAHDLENQDASIDPKPKSGKSRLNLHGTILEENSIGSNPQTQQKRAQTNKRKLMI